MMQRSHNARNPSFSIRAASVIPHPSLPKKLMDHLVESLILERGLLGDRRLVSKQGRPSFSTA